MKLCLLIILIRLSMVHVEKLPTCSNVDDNELTVIETCVSFGKHNYRWECDISSNDESYHNRIILQKMTDKIGSKSSTNVSCIAVVKIQSIYNSRELHVIETNTNITAGLVLEPEECQENNDLRTSDCSRIFYINTAILELPIVKYGPKLKYFWNFSSHLFSSSNNWLKSIKVNYNFTVDYFSTLYGTGLKELTICNNKILPAMLNLPMNIPTLLSLEIVNSHISNVRKGHFCRVKHLLSLAIKKNSINRTPQGISDLKKLKHLDLSENYDVTSDIFFIDTEGIEAALQLEDLNLSFNRIYSIAEKLPRLPHLNKLNLSNCYLSSLKRNEFLNLPALEVLDLSGNNLKVLDSETFLGLHFVRHLDLSRNQLHSWPILFDCYLENINLSTNCLETLTNLGKFGTVARYLDLSSNIISTWDDPEIFSFPSKMKLSHNSRDYFSSNKIESWVLQLIMYNNSITTVSKAMAKSLDVLISVNLNENPLNCTKCQAVVLEAWVQQTPIPELKVIASDSSLCSSKFSKTTDSSLCLQEYLLSYSIGIPLIAAFLLGGISTYFYKQKIQKVCFSK